MSEDDPLAALSAAASKRPTSRRPPTSHAAPAYYPPQPYHGPRRPQKRQSNALLFTGFIIAGLLGVGLSAGIYVTVKILNKPAPPPPKKIIMKPQPGELYTNVKSEDPSKPKPPTE